jgi:hypothetical protein
MAAEATCIYPPVQSSELSLCKVVLPPPATSAAVACQAALARFSCDVAISYAEHHDREPCHVSGAPSMIFHDHPSHGCSEDLRGISITASRVADMLAVDSVRENWS